MHQNSIFDLVWDGKHIITASADKTCKVVDVETGAVLSVLGEGTTGDKGHQGSVKQITKVSKNIVASGGRDGKIILHDIRLKTGHANTISEYVFAQQIFNKPNTNFNRRRTESL